MMNTLKSNLRTFAQNYARVGLAIVLFLEIFFSYAGAPRMASAQVIPDALNTNKAAPLNVPTYSGVDQSIADYLCVPDAGNTGTALYQCIGKVYRFGIAFGGIALVFFIVFAGYMYMTGGESGKAKGKSMLFSALTGMAIILSSYVLLNFINPDLVKIKTIQPPIFTAADLPSCEDVGFGVSCVLQSGQVRVGSGSAGYGTGKCSPITNDASPASVNNLSKSCFAKYGDTVVKQASIVASRESNGVPGLPVGEKACPGGKLARCTGGEIPVYGMFQINLTAHPVAGLNCPAAFKGGFACSTGCTVKDPALYNKCVAAVKQPVNDINTACKIYADSVAAKLPPWNAWGNRSNAHAIACGF